MNYRDTYFNHEQTNMNGIDIQTLVSVRLEDMADQVQHLYEQGNFADAELIRNEGMMLAEAYDNENIFLFINDLTGV